MLLEVALRYRTSVFNFDTGVGLGQIRWIFVVAFSGFFSLKIYDC